MVQTGMSNLLKVLPARFFRTLSGNEPVREWLKDLIKEDRGIIGDDIRTVEFGWPLGMPLCRSIGGLKDLWEVRSKISRGRIARVIFYVKDREMILLHGFIKKTQKTAAKDLSLATKRRKEFDKNA
jgi:phage-related protein